MERKVGGLVPIIVPRRYVGGPIPARMRVGGLVMIPRRQYGGNINLGFDGDGGEDDDSRTESKTTRGFGLDQLSVPSYKAPPDAGRWMEQRMRDTMRQKKKEDDNPTAKAIDSLGSIATKLAPLALMALKDGGKVITLKRLQDGGYADNDDDDDDDQDTTDTSAAADDDDDATTGVSAPSTTAGVPLPPPRPPAAGEPTDLDLSGGYTVPPGTMTMSAPRAPRDAYAQAGIPPYGRAGAPSTTVIPGLGPPPRSFAQRWATNPFTAAGAAMLQSRSPYFGAGLGAGIAAGAGAVERGRKEELLDQRPQMLTDGDTIKYRVGNKIVDTGLRSPQAARREAQAARQEAIETRQERLERTRQEGRLELERERQKRPARTTTAGQDKIVADIDRLMKTELTSSADIKGGSPTISTDEAYRRAVVRYNALNPGRQLPVPPAPPREAPPAESVDTRSWWERNMPGFLGGQEKPSATAKKPPTAPAETETPPQAPAAPAEQAPQQTRPPQAPPVAAEAGRRLKEAIAKGQLTTDQAIAQAQAAIRAGKNRAWVEEMLREAGLEFPISGQAAPVPQSR